MGNEEVDFTLIYTSTKPLEIAAAISLLEEQDIPAYKINKKDSSYIFAIVRYKIRQPFSQY